MHPADEYRSRLQDREARVANAELAHIRVGNLRLLLATAAAAILWFSIHRHAFSPWWTAAPALAFVAVAIYHSRVLRAQQLAIRAVNFYKHGLARIENRWKGLGQTGARFSDPHHVYSDDLDLFGRGGLFELLSTARMRMGEETLAKWLLAPSTVSQIRDRHSAIQELRDQLDFREEIAVAAEELGVHPTPLQRWAEAPNQMGPSWLRWLSAVLAILVIAAATLWATTGTPSPFIAILVTELILTFALRNKINNVLKSSEQAFRDLSLLSKNLARFEQKKFTTPHLQRLQNELRSHGVEGSRALAHLSTLVDLTDSRDNVLLAVLDKPLMYSVQLAFATENWRRAHGHAVRTWLSVIGEMEALLSLATYSYEHPEDPFPEFIEGPACFTATAIGHPLIPSEACVRNDVSLLSTTAPVILVSGSNMSGKSTLLRTVGINAVLAMTGAPVRAAHLTMTPIQVGASIRVNDSLQEGSSRFYAEITRIRRIFDLAANDVSAPSTLFLLDELLQGTNSNDRRVGAEGIIRALLKRNAIGMVSTHDLALADIVGTLKTQIQNVHFQDDFENGKMHFDHTLRQGIVTKSNGLALMRSIGLDV